ncbi:hypothetical protein HY345_00475 [Candidatus Microgenomates bacterium]|nr:hypothetical protein [Candidatus Microgenomates bacterium]
MIENEINIDTQTNLQVNNDSLNEKKSHAFNWNGNYWVAVAVVLFVILLTASFSIFVIVSNRKHKSEIKPTIITPTRITPTGIELPTVPKQYPSKTPNSTNETEDKILAKGDSPDGKYTLSFITAETNEIGTLIKCKVSLTESSTNKEIDIKSFFPTQLIRCDSGLGNFSSDFIQWAKHILVIDDNENGQIKLVDIDNQKTTTHQYNKSSYSFLGVDNTLSYWLYNKKNTKPNPAEFIVLDNNEKQIVSKTINIDYYVVRTVYDPKNNGFLFIYSLTNEEATQNAVKQGINVGNGLEQSYFDFFQIDKLQETNLLTTDPYPVFGRGCYEEGIEFQKSRIIINSNNGSCLQIDPKYYSAGKIILEVK